MAPKTVAKKSARSEDETKKKEGAKGSKKNSEDANAGLGGSTDLASTIHENQSSSKIPPVNLNRGASQLGTPSEENTNREAGVSTSELSHHADGIRDGIDPGENHGSTTIADPIDIKYEEPILPNLIILSYDGAKEKGLFEGYGKATYVGGHHYSGDWSGGMMNGHGRYEWADGVVYTGTIVNNQIDGNGFYQWPDGSIYQGDVQRGRRHGQGNFRHGQKPLSYEGTWNMGNIHGKGILHFDRQGLSYYDGSFINNIPHGKGRRQYASGNLYEGMWVNGKRHGYGIFSWSNGNGEYTGQWKNGVQNGHGTHVWYIIRAEESQYALRNYYEGNFLNGHRHGFGVFYYSSGTKYSGEWKCDQKHGKGQVILRNGLVIEAEFSNDRIITPISSDMASMLAIEMPEIVSKTPIPSASNALDPMNLIRSESRNTLGPSFKLQLDGVFHYVSDADDDRQNLIDQVFHVLLRHLPQLKQIYRIYARLGVDTQTNVDNTFLMTRMQFWRFLLDCHLHEYGVSLLEYDRLIAECLPTQNPHDPDQSILVREFLNAIGIISFHLHRLNKINISTSAMKQPISLQVAATMEVIIEKNIFPNAGNIQGNLFVDVSKYLQASQHRETCHKAYILFSNKNTNTPYDTTMQKRDFLFMLKRLQITDPVHLTAARIISILAENDNNIRLNETNNSSAIRLNIEMCFLEFFEALIGCALIHPGSKYYNTMVRRPKTVTSEQSLGSQPSIGSPSAHDRHVESRTSEYPNILVREISEMTHETVDDIEKSRSLISREREQTGHIVDTSSVSSYSVKLEDFFNGIFLPATAAFENIRAQIRFDQEKTWQGISSERNNDEPWPKPYTALV